MNKEKIESIKIDTNKIIFQPFKAFPVNRPAVKTVAYFDDKGIFHRKKAEEIVGIVTGLTQREDGSYLLKEKMELPGNNLSLIAKAVKMLREGDTFSDFLTICEAVRFEVSAPLNFMERFIAKIEPPEIFREPENLNEKTFDFIRIQIHLSDMGIDTKSAVSKHFKEITELTFKKIEKDAQFKCYGVPVNILKLTKATITRQKVLVLLFEVKEETYD